MSPETLTAIGVTIYALPLYNLAKGSFLSTWHGLKARRARKDSEKRQRELELLKLGGPSLDELFSQGKVSAEDKTYIETKNQTVQDEEANSRSSRAIGELIGPVSLAMIVVGTGFQVIAALRVLIDVW